MRKRRMIVFTSSQFKVLAEFFNDLAKGMILAAIIGQGFVLKVSPGIRIISLIFWILCGCVFLEFALYFMKESEDES